MGSPKGPTADGPGSRELPPLTSQSLRATLTRMIRGKGSQSPEREAASGAAPAHRPARALALRAGDVYPIIPGRLFFSVHTTLDMTQTAIEQFPNLFFFSSDHQERYEPFCADFGPVNLAVVHDFCNWMDRYWGHKRLKKRELVYYSDADLGIRTNTAFLLAAFLVIRLGYTPEKAWEPFSQIEEGAFATYRDATFCAQKYHLSVMACLQGLIKALACGFYDPQTFDDETYRALEHSATGDMHAVCPKFVAFRGPTDERIVLAPGIYSHTPEDLAETFHLLGVSAVVRLNEPSTYDAQRFVDLGFEHQDLHFQDCTAPTALIVERFLDICEQAPGVVAVHCMAGLGRTGTLIAIYLMKHFGFTASECIGWLRIVRPGSVIGRQQEYLHVAQERYRVELGTGGKRLSATSLDDFETDNTAPAEEAEAMGVAVAAAQRARGVRVAARAAEEAAAAPPGPAKPALQPVHRTRRRSLTAVEPSSTPHKSPSTWSAPPLAIDALGPSLRRLSDLSAAPTSCGSSSSSLAPLPPLNVPPSTAPPPTARRTSIRADATPPRSWELGRSECVQPAAARASPKSAPSSRASSPKASALPSPGKGSAGGGGGVLPSVSRYSCP